MLMAAAHSNHPDSARSRLQKLKDIKAGPRVAMAHDPCRMVFASGADLRQHLMGVYGFAGVRPGQVIGP